jgi:hypothetical protein
MHHPIRTMHPALQPTDHDLVLHLSAFVPVDGVGSRYVQAGALAIGLGIGALASCAATPMLRIGNRIPEDLVLAETALGPSLTQLGPGSLLVAAAGMAGMLSFERASGAAGGVATSAATLKSQCRHRARSR